MTKRKSIRIACGAVALGLVMAASSHAVSMNHENRLTFNRPVALPGVVLPAGTYSFDLEGITSSLNIVAVRNAARTKVFYMGFTVPTSRPHGMSKDAAITFLEAPANQPPPIAAWYEIGDSLGHEFLYR